MTDFVCVGFNCLIVSVLILIVQIQTLIFND